MSDTTQIPVFPSVTKSTNPGHTSTCIGQRPSSSSGTTSVVIALRRMVAGVMVGMVLVACLWYLLQHRQHTAAKVVDPSLAPVVQGVVLVTVAQGDTLWDIAAYHRPGGIGQDQWVHDVAAYNQIAPDAIFAGQVLAIPTYSDGDVAIAGAAVGARELGH